jgi:2-phospho-L-lactate transferase/gluconeogenesis factor (CofD/UPF0052 family)
MRSMRSDLEAVILCPANPYHTIRPILEVPGMREMLRKRGAPVNGGDADRRRQGAHRLAGKIMRGGTRPRRGASHWSICAHRRLL